MRTLTPKHPTRRTFKFNPLLLVFAFTVLTACSFVDTLPGSETVVVSGSADPGCQKLGETQVKVLDSIIGIDRDLETMADELATLARNAAFKKGGDTIVADSVITDGEQNFIIYRCR